MERYSVIIPTLWKSIRTIHLIEQLIDCPYVGEVVLISNTRHYNNPRIKDPRVIIIEPEENLYVNPSWNLGVEASQFDNIIICNDDVTFDPNLYFYLLDQVDLKKRGFIGMSSENYELLSPNSPTIKKYEAGTWGWGCIIALHKENWIPIPDALKIWCGDSFMIEVNPAPTFTMHGVPVKTEMSTTSDLAKFDQVKQQDLINWQHYLKQHYTNNG